MEKENFTKEEISFLDDQFKIIIGDACFVEREKSFHEEVEIKYLYEGTGVFAIDNSIISVDAGEIVVINPYEIHANVNLGNARGRYYNIVIGLDFFSDEVKKRLKLTQKLLVEGKKFCTHIKNDQRLKALIARIVEEIKQKKEYHQVIVHSLIGELFSLLLRDYIDEERSSNTKCESIDNMGIILAATSKIYTDYGTKLSIEELAGCCNISKYYFCRTFKKVMNKTVMQFITEYRLNIAEQLIKTTKKSFAEIAWICGFETEGYFGKCYKKFKGKTPRKAREEADQNK